MSEEYIKTSCEQHQEQYSHIDLPASIEDLDMTDPEQRRGVYAQADLLHFEGVLPPALDKLIRKEDVAALFSRTFRYAVSTFEKTDHYRIVKHPWYRAEFAWRRRSGSWHAANTLWYTSRVIALILALKRSPSRKDLGITGAPDYPHPTDGWTDQRSSIAPERGSSGKPHQESTASRYAETLGAETLGAESVN